MNEFEKLESIFDCAERECKGMDRFQFSATICCIISQWAEDHKVNLLKLTSMICYALTGKDLSK